MIPLVDLHVHLLAGLDDGPRSEEDALQMCHDAYKEGVQLAAATAHQNETYPDVTPDIIRDRAARLADALRRDKLPLQIFPTAEVMASPDLEKDWQRGHYLSVGDRKQFLLLEMPHGLYVELRDFIGRFQRSGVQFILAHPERQPELLHEPGLIEQLVQAGCLVQICSGSVTDPRNREDLRALKDWLRRGIVHFLGSDGHSLHRRPIRMMAAYHQIARWTSYADADRICSANGIAVLQGLPLYVADPLPRRSRWPLRFW